MATAAIGVARRGDDRRSRAGPGSADQVLDMVKPMGLTEKKSLLYVGCGLGGATQAIVRNYAARVVGLDASPLLAKAGMELSEKAGLAKKAPIQHFDPDKLELQPHKFDAACFRHSLSGVENKKRVMAEVEKALRPEGHFMISDFALTRPGPGSPALLALLASEGTPSRFTTLDDMKASVEALKLDLRIAEDTTEEFRRLVTEGWTKFADTIKGKSLDAEEAVSLASELKLRQNRLAAIDAGDLCVVRVYALKQIASAEVMGRLLNKPAR